MTKASGESIDGTASRRIADTEGKPICRINVYPNVKKITATSMMQEAQCSHPPPGARLGPQGVVPY